MRKDIDIPTVQNVAIAVVKELNNEKTHDIFNVYLINLKNVTLENVMITSKGYGMHKLTGENIKTSTLRHQLGTIKAKSYVKIEPIMDNVFGISNEYWLSFFEGTKMHDKKYIFLPETIVEDNFVTVPLINKQGVIIR
ncbi:MAG TPA: hypothetical protein EYG85_06695 [Crocinitomix sp.]|nr:hypothetical protein [Crocinitomix sp.]